MIAPDHGRVGSIWILGHNSPVHDGNAASVILHAILYVWREQISENQAGYPGAIDYDLNILSFGNEPDLDFVAPRTRLRL